MANEKLVTLEQLGIVKNYIDVKDAAAIKAVDYADNKLSFYTTADKSGEAAIEVDLPEEMFLDQTKTTLVDDFVWSSVDYPGSADPELNGKPVLVLAVKGDDSINYSFLSMESIVPVYSGGETATVDVSVTDGVIKADVKVSAEAGNAITVNGDGLHVAVPNSVTYATDDEVRSLFNT